jgi:hypothetical protein
VRVWSGTWWVDHVSGIKPSVSNEIAFVVGDPAVDAGILLVRGSDGCFRLTPWEGYRQLAAGIGFAK